MKLHFFVNAVSATIRSGGTKAAAGCCVRTHLLPPRSQYNGINHGSNKAELILLVLQHFS